MELLFLLLVMSATAEDPTPLEEAQELNEQLCEVLAHLQTLPSPDGSVPIPVEVEEPDTAQDTDTEDTTIPK